MLKDVWVPIILGILSLFTGYLTAKIHNKSKSPEYSTMTIKVLQEVFSRYHFEKANSLDTDKLTDFLSYLDKNEFSSFLYSLYDQAQNVLKLDSKPIRQEREFKNFVKQYTATNRQLCKSIGFDLPTGPKLLDEPFMVGFTVVLGSTSLLFADLIVYLFLNEKQNERLLSLLVDVLINFTLSIGIAGILTGILLMFITGIPALYQYIKKL